VMSPDAAFIVADILSDRAARGLNIRLRKSAIDTVLDGSQDRHKQGHEGQLGASDSHRVTP